MISVFAENSIPWVDRLIRSNTTFEFIAYWIAAFGTVLICLGIVSFFNDRGVLGRRASIASGITVAVTVSFGFAYLFHILVPEFCVRQNTLLNLFKCEYPALPDFGCGPGCVVEDAGKVNAYDRPEVQALIEEQGLDRVLVKALDRHLIGQEEHWHATETEDDRIWREAHDHLLELVLKPGLNREEVGCVIVVYVLGEGYVYWEDHDLNIIASETLAEFQARTSEIDRDVMQTFYLSLR